MPLTYPDWFTVLDRRRIDDAIEKAATLMVVHDLSTVYGSDSVAVQGVLLELEAVAGALLRHRDRMKVQELQSAADGLHDQIIVEADRHRFATDGLETFVAAIEDALAGQPWWPVAPQSAMAPSKGSHRAGEYPNQARWLTDCLRDLGLTRNRLKDLGGPDGKTTKRLLEGSGAGAEVLVKVARALTEAYRQDGRRKIIRPEDIPRD